MNKLLSALIVIVVISSCKDSSKQSGNKKPESALAETSNLKELESPADTASAEPYLFTDKNGLVYLSWIEKTKGKSILKISTLNNELWSEPMAISSGDNW